MKLPLQRGGKLRQQKGPDSAVARRGHGHVAAEGNQGKHQSHRRHHAGRPEKDMQTVRQGEEQALDRQPRPQQPPQPEASAPPGILDDDKEAGAPFGESGDNPGNVGLVDGVHGATPPTQSVSASRKGPLRPRLMSSLSPRTIAQPSCMPSTCSRFTR